MSEKMSTSSTNLRSELNVEKIIETQPVEIEDTEPLQAVLRIIKPDYRQPIFSKQAETNRYGIILPVTAISNFTVDKSGRITFLSSFWLSLPAEKRKKIVELGAKGIGHDGPRANFSLLPDEYQYTKRCNG